VKAGDADKPFRFPGEKRRGRYVSKLVNPIDFGLIHHRGMMESLTSFNLCRAVEPRVGDNSCRIVTDAGTGEKSPGREKLKRREGGDPFPVRLSKDVAKQVRSRPIGRPLMAKNPKRSVSGSLCFLPAEMWSAEGGT